MGYKKGNITKVNEDIAKGENQDGLQPDSKDKGIDSNAKVQGEEAHCVIMRQMKKKSKEKPNETDSNATVE